MKQHLACLSVVRDVWLLLLIPVSSHTFLSRPHLFLDLGLWLGFRMALSMQELRQTNVQSIGNCGGVLVVYLYAQVFVDCRAEGLAKFNQVCFCKLNYAFFL